MPNKRRQGFTIIELMVSAAIIGVISVIVIANFRGYTQKTALDNEAERLSGTLRQANIHALTGMIVNGVQPPGFGIHFTKCTSVCSYFIFADNGNYAYDAGDTITQQFGMLENDVKIDNFTPDNGFNYLDLVFSAPRGEIYINGSQSAPEGIVFLSHKNSSFVRGVKLNRFSGSINIE